MFSKIEYGHTPKVLLFGNSINRAYGFDSWDGLIKSIQKHELTKDEEKCLKSVPYPLRPVILTEDHLDTQIKTISPKLSELRAPEEEETLLRDYAALPVDAILTANYTYELEKALDANFKCLPGRRCKSRKLAYSESGKYNAKQLHTCFTIGEFPPIWHIHGEAAKHDTMILGHYYYGKLLSKMQQYISSLMARYKTGVSQSRDMAIHSWVDYFLLGDVYIVGLGMALSELDFWWLINCKKRHFPDTKVTLYKPSIKLEEKLLAEAYGVIVNTSGFNGDYKEYYHWLYKELEQKL